MEHWLKGLATPWGSTTDSTNYSAQPVRLERILNRVPRNLRVVPTAFGHHREGKQLETSLPQPRAANYDSGAPKTKMNEIQSLHTNPKHSPGSDLQQSPVPVPT